MLDVYSGDGVIQWPAVKLAGHAIAYMKCTQGTQHIDSHFRFNLARSLVSGIIPGAYHFLNASSAIQQAQHFFSILTVSNWQYEHWLPVALDIEPEGSGLDSDNVNLIDTVDRFITTFEKLSGFSPILYGDKDFLDKLDGEFSGHSLWLAQYTDNETPELPIGWNDWLFWQYSVNGSVPGVENKTADLSRYNGTLEELKQRIKNEEWKKE